MIDTVATAEAEAVVDEAEVGTKVAATRSAVQWIFQTTGVAFASGCGLGLLRAASTTSPASVAAGRKAALKLGVSFGLFAAVFSGGVYVVERFRGKRDIVGSVFGGAVAGTVMGTRSGFITMSTTSSLLSTTSCSGSSSRVIGDIRLSSSHSSMYLRSYV